MMKTKNMLGWLPVAGLALGAGHAAAAGFQLLEQNASGLGNAYAGSAAVAENASTVFYNPAGMTALGGDREVSVGLDIIRPSMKFQDQGSTLPALITTGRGDGADAGGYNYAPNGYFALRLTPKLSLGFGFGAPFGLKTTYTGDFAGRFLALTSDIKTYNLNPSLAYKVNDKISLGFGLNYQKLEATLGNAVNYSGALFAGSGGTVAIPNLEGIATVTANDWAWGWNAGALFQISETTRVGVAYRSTVNHKAEGDVSFQRPSTGNAGADGVLAAATPNGPVKSTIKLPDSFTLSVLQRLDEHWEMLGDASWTGWSTLPSLDIYRSSGPLLSSENLQWRNTWRFALGSNYAYSSGLKLKFGVAYDQSPVTDTYRLARLPDSNRTWVSLGAQFTVTPKSRIDVGYAHLFMNDPSINANGGSAAAKGQLVGNYESSVDILGLQYSAGF
jgi:long-chain fatty acid transport protein